MNMNEKVARAMWDKNRELWATEDGPLFGFKEWDKETPELRQHWIALADVALALTAYKQEEV